MHGDGDDKVVGCLVILGAIAIGVAINAALLYGALLMVRAVFF